MFENDFRVILEMMSQEEINALLVCLKSRLRSR